MKEYIARQNAILACFDGWNNSAQDCAENIRLIPAEDVRIVVHKQWRPRSRHTVVCTGCEFEVDIMKVPSYILNHLHYCPNCGADMRQVRYK